MFNFFYDLIFPKRCVGCKKFGNYLCDNCVSFIEIYEQYVCPMCLKRSITGETHPSCITAFGVDGLISGVVYKGVVKKFLFRLKYPPYLSDLKKTLGKLFIEMLFQQELFMRFLTSQPIVVEVPLSGGKLKKRGYNQAEILAKIISHEFNLNFFPKTLIRIKSTKPQFKLNKEQRLKNVQGAFDIEPKYKKEIRGKAVYLVDDLATSCATLKECAKILKRNGAKKVYGVTFAREI